MAYNWERVLIMYQLFFFNNILCRHQYFLLSVTLLHNLYKKCCKKSFYKYFCRINPSDYCKTKKEKNSQLWLFLSNRPFFEHKKRKKKKKKALILLNTSLRMMAIKYIHKTICLCQGNNLSLQIALEFSTSIKCSKIHISFIENSNFELQRY